MPCSERTPCAGILYEDRTFQDDAQREDMNLHRFSCMNGHSYYSGPEVTARGWRARAQTGRVCTICDQPIPLGATKHPECARKEKHSVYYGLCQLCLFPIKHMKNGNLYHDHCTRKLPKAGMSGKQ